MGPSLLKCNLGEFCAGQHSVFYQECWVKFVSFGAGLPSTAHRWYNNVQETLCRIRESCQLWMMTSGNWVNRSSKCWLRFDLCYKLVRSSKQGSATFSICAWSLVASSSVISLILGSSSGTFLFLASSSAFLFASRSSLAFLAACDSSSLLRFSSAASLLCVLNASMTSWKETNRTHRY